MELLNAIKSLGAFAVYLFNQWFEWAWYLKFLSSLVLLFIIFFIGIFTLAIFYGYQKPTMLNDKETQILGMFVNKKNMEGDKDYGTPGSMSLQLIIIFLFFGVITYYCFSIPWIGIKAAIITVLISIAIYYFKIVINYGYAILPAILIITTITILLSLNSFNFGLPDFPPHYIFDWWGLGINSTSNSVHILPFPNITVNATDYEINFNQYYYLLVLLISLYGIFLNLSNLVKWRNKNYDKSIKIKTDSSIEIDISNVQETINNERKIYNQLKDIGFSQDSINIIKSEHSDLTISEVLHDMIKQNPDNQKKYIINRLNSFQS
ncbi:MULTISPECIES: hypothetical protein [Cysteiniphilum]|uniref:Uncharacterized protein n=1 Tax=Cysteiniphilum litorale TaxID=2056700 RepID=A0A8J2Z504_9GAMM|nr:MULTISPECIES: hypothetical protein [Cysteiniphilum]GGF99006.1 hypothetical protein GCM10010995_15320 [Cysteiniphilum litorale]